MAQLKKLCPKCGGKGFIAKYRRDGGKCFECGGTGFIYETTSKGKTKEKPVRGQDGKKPLSNKGYKNLLLDDLMRVNPQAISGVAEMKEFRTALKLHADKLGIPYKYATPTRTLMRMIREKLIEKM